MSTVIHLDNPDAKLRDAIDELTSLIGRRYPAASFDISEAPDDPETVHVYATVDVDEPEQVLDLVIERVLALQEEGIPIHVIPLRTPEREAAMLEAERKAAAGPSRM